MQSEADIEKKMSVFGGNVSRATLLAAYASLGLTDKRDESFNLWNRRQFRGNPFERMFGSELRLEDNAVGLTDGIDDASVEAAAFQAFEIEAVQFGAIAGRVTVGRNILGNHRSRANDRTGADAHELMNAHKAADDDKIFDGDVAAEGRTVRDDIAITDDAIMGDMALHHKEVLITDSRDHSAACSAGIERDIFADRIGIANQELARLAFVFKVLRNGADRREWKYNIVVA